MSIRCAKIVVYVALAWSSAAPLAVAAPPPTATIPASVVKVNPSTPGASAAGHLVVIVDGLAGPDDKTALTDVADVKGAASALPIVEFDTRHFSLPPSGQQRRWVLPFTVKGMPANTELTRYVEFKLGAVPWTLAYQLARGADTSSSWSLKPQPVAPQAIEPGGSLPLWVNVNGATPVTGVRVAPVLLIEAASNRRLADARFALCETSEPCTAKEIRLEGGGAHQLWLVPQAASATQGEPRELAPGKYSGVVTLTSHDKPLGESSNVVIHVQSVPRQFVGFGLIVLGIVLAWVFTTFMRGRMTRDQMLMPAVVMRRDMDKLRMVLDSLESALPTGHLREALGKLDEALADDELLNRGLPSMALPWPPSSAGAETLKAYLEAQSSKLGELEKIVKQGFVTLSLERAEHLKSGAVWTPAQSQAFDDAADALDALVFEVPLGSTLQTSIKDALKIFFDALPPRVTDGAARGIQPDGNAKDLREPEVMRLRITRNGALAWGFIGIVTALTGLHILIITNTGFGTPYDLVNCLLWGLGLPAGASMINLAASSVATTFGVSR